MKKIKKNEENGNTKSTQEKEKIGQRQPPRQSYNTRTYLQVSGESEITWVLQILVLITPENHKE